MHADYSQDYITELVARLYQQIEDELTLNILTTYLDFTDDSAKDVLDHTGLPKYLAYDDDIGSVLLNAEDSGDPQDVYNILDTDYQIFQIVDNK